MSEHSGPPESGRPTETARTGRAGAAHPERRSTSLGALDPVAAYERRTTRIREEIARNRRGEYTVPTWVLAVALAAVIALWILVLFVF